MRHKHEWDYPPERRGRRSYAFPANTDIMASPAVTRVADVYWKIVWTALKMVIGGICGFVIFGCIWLMIQILSLS